MIATRYQSYSIKRSHHFTNLSVYSQIIASHFTSILIATDTINDILAINLLYHTNKDNSTIKRLQKRSDQPT